MSHRKTRVTGIVGTHNYQSTFIKLGEREQTLLRAAIDQILGKRLTGEFRVYLSQGGPAMVEIYRKMGKAP